MCSEQNKGERDLGIKPRKIDENLSFSDAAYI